MYKKIATLTITILVTLLAACSNQPSVQPELENYYEIISDEYDSPDDEEHNETYTNYMPEEAKLSPENKLTQIPTIPVQIKIDDIPHGIDPANFIHELGYESFTEHEFLQWGAHWIALRTNTAIYDFRIIEVIPHYEASFDDGWQYELFYSSPRVRHEIDLLPGKPFVMAWADWGITEWGLQGIAYIDADGSERHFILRWDGNETYLEEFENSPHEPDSPMITIMNPSPEIELVVAWFVDDWWAGQGADYGIAKYNFLQQFESYTEFNNPYVNFSSYAVFSSNTDLYDFQLFRIGFTCDPQVGDEWHFFYIGEIIDFQEIVSFGEPVVIPWHPGGTWPNFGISFLDEDGHRHNFSLNSNNGSGFPPMFISSFEDKGCCPSYYNYSGRRTCQIVNY